MAASSPGLSVVILAHREGTLVHAAVRSALRAMAIAQAKGIECELLAVADRPDAATADYFERQQTLFSSVITTDFGDPGQARNYIASLATREYITFLGADHLISESWLAEGYRLALEADSQPVVIHPEYNLYFGAAMRIQRQLEWPSAGLSDLDLLENNCWSPVFLCQRALVTGQCPYPAAARHAGFGSEDWIWNCETLAQGIPHRVAPATAAFIRCKEETPGQAEARPFLLPPLELFADERIAAQPPPPGWSWRQKMQALPYLLRLYISWRWVSLHELVTRGGEELFPSTSQCVGNLVRGLQGLRWRRLRIPDWLAAEWKEMQALDLELFPSRQALNRLQEYRFPRSRLAQSYLEVMNAFGPEPSHVFLLAWLKPGGADLEALHHMTALCQTQPAARVVCVLTEHADHPWLDRLPPGVRVVDFGRITVGLPDSLQDLLLAQVLMQKGPGLIQTVNSRTGYRVMNRFGQQLAARSTLAASTFCNDYDAAGRVISFAEPLSRCVASLSAIISDNQRMVEYLEDTFAIPAEKCFTVYFPAPPCQEIRPRGRQPVLQVLWAGRLDRQKRPDVLVQIAEALAGQPFHFQVYGKPLLNLHGRALLRRLKRQANVTWHGPFDGFNSIPAGQHDVFLYTSHWDGMPNVLLEAAAAGLPLIAPAVGGIPELVSQKTGYLVSKPDAIEEYVQALQAAAHEPEAAAQKARAAQALLAEQHSWPAFLARMEQIPGYRQSRTCDA